jgi:hypothetical protein
MYGKRLYDMGGDIISSFYPSGTSESSLLLGDGERKKKKLKNKKVIFGTGKPLKKGQHRGCRGKICT